MEQLQRNVPVQSVRKALDLLSVLAFEDLHRQGVPLTVLARRMKMPPNTAHNLLRTMAACGYVMQTEAGAYAAGPRCAEMARLNRILSGTAAQAVRDRMEQLSRESGEAVTFAVLSDGRRVLVWQVQSQHVVRVDASALETRSIYAVPTGRVLLAFESGNERDKVIERYGLPGVEWGGIQSRAQLEKALAGVREQGQESIVPDGKDLASFAVPVLDSNGCAVGALGCYAPLFRCPPRKRAALLAQLLSAAKEIARHV